MRSLWYRSGWIAAGILAVALLVVLAGRTPSDIAFGGAPTPTPDPLEPASPPADTMQTLADLPPHWSRVLPADDGPDSCHSSRFECLPDLVGVLDRSTGLVWQLYNTSGWYGLDYCKNVGFYSSFGATGWRLPARFELLTLFDSTTGQLPLGHPFEIDTTDGTLFWTADSAYGTGDVRQIVLDVTNPQSVDTKPKTESAQAWCVRGPGGFPLIDPDRIPTSWSRMLDSAGSCISERFSCPAYGVVLDRETGLLWEKTPSTSTTAWAPATAVCLRRQSQRLGWRLPTADELSTIVQPVVSGGPSLYPDSPFTIGASNFEFWTSTTDPADATKAFSVPFVYQGVGDQWLKSVTKTTATLRVWCVRGPGGS